MNRPIKYFFLSIVLLGLCSCGKDDPSGKVTAIILTNELFIKNNSSKTIYTFSGDQETFAVLGWAPSVEGQGIEAGETDREPLDDVFGYSEDTEVILVHYWNAIEIDGIRTAGEISTITLNL